MNLNSIKEEISEHKIEIIIDICTIAILLILITCNLKLNNKHIKINQVQTEVVNKTYTEDSNKELSNEVKTELQSKIDNKLQSLENEYNKAGGNKGSISISINNLGINRIYSTSTMGDIIKNTNSLENLNKNVYAYSEMQNVGIGNIENGQYITCNVHNYSDTDKKMIDSIITGINGTELSLVITNKKGETAKITKGDCKDSIISKLKCYNKQDLVHLSSESTADYKLNKAYIMEKGGKWDIIFYEISRDNISYFEELFGKGSIAEQLNSQNNHSYTVSEYKLTGRSQGLININYSAEVYNRDTLANDYYNVMQY